MEEVGDFVGVFAGVAQLLADALVPEFGQGFDSGLFRSKAQLTCRPFTGHCPVVLNGVAFGSAGKGNAGGSGGAKQLGEGNGALAAGVENSDCRGFGGSGQCARRVAHADELHVGIEPGQRDTHPARDLFHDQVAFFRVEHVGQADDCGVGVFQRSFFSP